MPEPESTGSTTRLCVLEFYEAVTGIETDLAGSGTAPTGSGPCCGWPTSERDWRGGREPAREVVRGTGFRNYVTEEPLTREEAEQMIEDYYEEWGWDRRSGVPTADRLEELGLTKDESQSGAELRP